MAHFIECARCDEPTEEDDTKDFNDEVYCPECYIIIRKGPNYNPSLQGCQLLAKSRGGQCLSAKYKGNKKHMIWMCSVGHQWHACFNNVKNGTWCPECSNHIPLTLTECHKLATSRNGFCLATEYKDSRIPIPWKCEFGHSWNACLSSVKRNHWCPHCAGLARLDISECHSLAKSKGGRCLSTVYVNATTKLTWECAKFHRWETRAGVVKNGHWCPTCVNCKKLTIDDCRLFAQSKKGLCLSDTYVNNSTPLRWKCDSGHKWSASFHSIKDNGYWCPCCKQKSESVAREIMEEIMGCSFNKAHPSWLKRLELDGYNEDLEMAFEYQGKQHYEHVDHFHRNGSTLEKQQKRDRAKARRCKRRNIALIVIPYSYSYRDRDAMYEFIEEEINYECYIQKRDRNAKS